MEEEFQPKYHGWAVNELRFRQYGSGPEEEIQPAITRILKKQYETPRSNLIKQVAKLLGFSRTGKRIVRDVDSEIGKMERDGALHP